MAAANIISPPIKRRAGAGTDLRSVRAAIGWPLPDPLLLLVERLSIMCWRLPGLCARGAGPRSCREGIRSLRAGAGPGPAAPGARIPCLKIVCGCEGSGGPVCSQPSRMGSSPLHAAVPAFVDMSNTLMEMSCALVLRFKAPHPELFYLDALRSTSGGH
ncbi:unnamed protein product [Coccothraustes coccothraustes]